MDKNGLAICLKFLLKIRGYIVIMNNRIVVDQP